MARLSSLVQCAFALALLGDVAARSASKYYQMTPGDVMIGGLYSIHDGGTDYSNCTGAIDETFVILSEAHLLSLDYVNEKVLASINMTMGTRMWDTCNSAAITLQHCVNFIDTTEQKDHGICGPTVNLTTSSYSAAPTEYDYDSMGVLAVTGAFWSSVAKNINYLMQAFCIPVVGTMSSSSEFDDQSRYPYFLRTCASDKYRAQVIFDTLQARGWLHATVLYSPYDSSFALKKEFQTLVDACSPTSADLRLFRPPCIERYIELQFEGNDDDESESQLTAQLEALRYLLNDGGPRVMLLLMPVNAITRLFEKLEEWGYHGNDLQFVVANGIEFDHDKRWNAFMNNTLSIENSLPDWAMLKQRLETITLQATNNTWLKELIVKQNDCCFSDSEIGSPFCSVERRPLCSGDEKLLSVPSVALKKARLIFEAINVIAHSVKAVHFELCGNNTVGYCSAMKKEITGRLLFENMLESSFEEDDHRTFEFFKVGKNRITNSGMPIFDVYQFQGDDWRVIQVAYNPFVGPGSTTDASQSANFSQYAIYEMIRPPLWDELARECDECQTECVRSYAYMKPGDQCCWTCRECENSFEIVNVTLQQCEMCPENTIPDEENRTQCVPVDSVSFVAKPNGLLVVLLGLSIVGALLSVFAGVFIHRHRKTPMARASTPDLCFAQAGCLLFMFLSTSLMLPTSSAFVCGFSWALSTTLLALCHAISTV
uniref:Receptor ligand binding region domain-containing protein n=1 Tax=Plectus sambesii TaxID=2011161 RepID=A0A914UJG1_9BILA